MTAIASNGTGGGNWSAGATWNGGVAPVEGDTVTIVSPDVVTIDGNITVGADTTTAAILVNSGAKLQVLAAVAGSYTLTAKGDIKISGTFEIGTVANPIPSNRKFTILLNYSAALAAGKYGLLIQTGGTFTAQGAAMTYDRAKLAADNGGICSTSGTAVTRFEGQPFTGKTGNIEIGGTVYTISSVADADHLTLTGSAGTRTLVSYVFASDNLAFTTDVSTGWADNDQIVMTPAARSPSQFDLLNLNGAPVGTALVVDGGTGQGGGSKYYHSGTSPMQSYVGNLTRNIVITSYNTGYMGYTNYATTATVDIDWVEFCYLGSTGAGKNALYVATTSGSFNLNRCSIHNTNQDGVYVAGSTSNNFTISNCVFYLCGSSNGTTMEVAATSGTNWSFTGNLVMYSTYAGNSCYFWDVGGTITNNVVCGMNAAGITLDQGSQSQIGTFSGNTCFCNGTSGIAVNNQSKGTLLNNTCYRNGAGGSTGPNLTQNSRDVIVDGFNAWGASTANISMGGLGPQYYYNLNLGGDPVYATTSGMHQTNSGADYEVYVDTASIGVNTGIYRPHGTQDIAVGSTYLLAKVNLKNVTLGSTTQIGQMANVHPDSFVKLQKPGTDKTWRPNGTVAPDTSIFDVTPSARITPSSASQKFELVVGKLFVDSGATATVSVKVRESVVGDGTDYNGARVRLICKRNSGAGINADTVLATATVASEGAFETISGTTPAVSADAVLDIVVDCDGTTGWVNVDTVAVA